MSRRQSPALALGLRCWRRGYAKEQTGEPQDYAATFRATGCMLMRRACEHCICATARAAGSMSAAWITRSRLSQAEVTPQRETERRPWSGRGMRGEGRRAPLAPVLARSMRIRTGGLPRKSVRLFANDAAQSTLRRRLIDHASNLADKCGTERADRRRRHQIIGFIDLDPVIFVQDQP